MKLFIINTGIYYAILVFYRISQNCFVVIFKYFVLKLQLLQRVAEIVIHVSWISLENAI